MKKENELVRTFGTNKRQSVDVVSHEHDRPLNHHLERRVSNCKLYHKGQTREHKHVIHRQANVLGIIKCRIIDISRFPSQKYSKYQQNSF